MSYINHVLMMNTIEKIKPGTITRIGYRSNVPVKAEFAKQGITVEKIVETSVRTGVAYNNIAEVKNHKSEKPSVTHKNNFVSVIKNKVKYNTNTDKYYMQCATLSKGSNTRVMYIVNFSDKTVVMTSKEFMDSIFTRFVQDSYFKKSDYRPVFTVNLENIYRIGNINIIQDITNLRKFE